MKKPPLFYGWYIALSGLVSYALGYGARYSFSVIFPCLLEEFNWPRDVTAGMLSVHILVYGLFAPLAGYLVDRTGPRKTMILGTSVLSLGLVLSSWSRTPGHFYISFGVLCGAGLCLIGSVPFTAVIRNWFEKKRGLALSVMFFGSGGAFASYPAVSGLIGIFGWRGTFLIESVIIAGVMIPLIAFVVRYHPMEKGLLRDGLPPERGMPWKSSGREMVVVDPAWAAVDWTLSKAVKTRRFWYLLLTIFSVWGVMEHIMVAHHIAYAIDAGYSRMYASSVLSLFGIFFAFGCLASLISDRIGRELTLTLGTVICTSAVVVFMLIRDPSHPWMLYYYALSLGIGMGLFAPTIPAAITDIFQGPRVGSVIGAIWFGFAIGGAIGPWIGGWLFERTGNYFGAFTVAIALNILACILIWLAAPRKVRRVARRSSLKVFAAEKTEIKTL